MDRDRLGEIVFGCIVPIGAVLLLVFCSIWAIWVWGVPAAIILFLCYLLFSLFQFGSELKAVKDELNSVRLSQAKLEESLIEVRAELADFRKADS